MTRKTATNPDQRTNTEEHKQSLAQTVEEQRKSQATIDSFVNGDYVPPQEQIKRDIQRIDDWYKGLPSEVQKAIKFMADKSWYWDREMDLQVLLDIQDVECTDSDIEAELERYFENEFDRIEEDIISRLKNTNRAGIILSVLVQTRSDTSNHIRSSRWHMY